MLSTSLLPIRNERATLRTMRHSDADAYAAGTRDAAVRKYGHLPEPEYTAESVRALIDGPIREGLDDGDLAVLAIADPTTDDFAGSLVLFGATGTSVEVGFWVHPDHRGKQLSTGALALAIELLRRSRITDVTARILIDNDASRRALERSGFVRGEAMHDTTPSGDSAVLLHYRRAIEAIEAFPLTTERLRLRLHEHSDVRALDRIYGRSAVARYLLDEPWTMPETVRHVGERIAHTGLADGGTKLALVVEHDGAVIGDVTLWPTDPEHRVAEIGWVLDPEWGGRGLASEAVNAVLSTAFTHYRLHRVAAQMDARNTASAELARRVGMTAEAHLRQNWWSKGEWTDTLIFGALAGDTDPHSGRPDRAPRAANPQRNRPL
ncbi:GNAT family N-acetyltransferase [Gordonia shandongensis]|uniref:GNAT family N-acetyltransferase n=1 Tax=Gordonia shandongensis TaxID=376351 RepID=UPI000A067576|nr:GNAT family N-acetyltransferase [Gordonia shandongensis]